MHSEKVKKVCHQIMFVFFTSLVSWIPTRKKNKFSQKQRTKTKLNKISINTTENPPYSFSFSLLHNPESTHPHTSYSFFSVRDCRPRFCGTSGFFLGPGCPSEHAPTAYCPGQVENHRPEKNFPLPEKGNHGSLSYAYAFLFLPQRKCAGRFPEI